jgi:hypothetical protein
MSGAKTGAAGLALQKVEALEKRVAGLEQRLARYELASLERTERRVAEREAGRA